MIDFTKPLYLLALLVIPLLLLIHFLTLKWKRAYALKFANFDAIARVKGVDLVSKNIFILLLTVVIILLLSFSLAGMQIERTLQASSFSFALALDSSRSMEANDFSPTRFDAAKETAQDFIDITPTGTKIAVVSFSGNSFIEEEISTDKTLIKQAIREIPLNTLGGTDLNEAVITATNLLQGESAKSIILISDGRINVGTIDDAINYANNNEVIVHTIGIGTEEGGETTYGFSTLDEDSLRGLAFNTGGEFFRATNREELSESLTNILQLENAKVKVDISSYLLMASIVLIVIKFLLVNTRYKTLP